MGDAEFPFRPSYFEFCETYRMLAHKSKVAKPWIRVKKGPAGSNPPLPLDAVECVPSRVLCPVYSV